jgi:hypothetical protein
MLKQFVFFSFVFSFSAVLAQTAPENVSPFLPSGSGSVKAGQTDLDSLQLRGLLTTNKGTRYCIFDPSTKRSIWLSVQEANDAFTIESADPKAGIVSVIQQGRRMSLALVDAKVTSTSTSVGASPALTRVVLNPTPQDEQRRLQAITEEINRRRQLREQQNQMLGQRN